MPSSHLIITVHGIRTYGEWQERLEKLVTDKRKDIDFVNYKYGYFSVIAFVIPFLRWLVVRKFRKELIEYCTEFPRTRIDLVGHSFGTHVVAWAIAGLPHTSTITVDTLILSGSVLRSGFPWHDLLGKRVKRIINDCGARDDVLILSQFFVLFTGMAGRVGFSGGTSVSFRNRYSVFGHSGYFINAAGLPYDEYMSARWVPLLITIEPIELFDERRPTTWSGAITVLSNNAEPIKLIVYSGPFIALSLYIFGLYSDAALQRDNALTAESRMAASLADQRTSEGDAAGASLTALGGLADGFAGEVSRPYVEDAARALLQSLARPQAIARLADAGIVATVSSDQQWLAVGTINGQVQLYRTDTWARVNSVQQTNSEVRALEFSSSGKYLAAAHRSDKAEVYVVEGMTPILNVRGHSSESVITSIAFSPDERTVVTGDGEGRLILTDVETQVSKRVEQAHPSSVQDVSFSPDGKLIITRGSRKTQHADGEEEVPDTHLKVWSSADLSLIADIDHLAFVLAYAVSPDSKRIAIAGDGSVLRTWDVSSRADSAVIPHGQGLVQWAHYIDQETVAVTSGTDIEIIDTRQLRTNKLVTSGRRLAAVFKFAGGDAISLATNDRTVARFDLVSGVRRIFSHRDMRFVSAATDPSGSMIVGVGPDGTAVWRQPKSAADAFFWPDADPKDVAVRAVSADGLHSAIIRRGPDAKTIVVYNHRAGGRRELVLDGVLFVDAAYSSDGVLLASSGFDTRTRSWVVHLWDSDSGTPLGPITRASARVENVVFDAGGDRLALSLQNGVMELYSTTKLELIARTQTKSSYGQVDISPDGRYIIRDSSIGDDRKVILLDSRDKSTHEIPIPDGGYFGFAGFLHDGRAVVSGDKGRVAIGKPDLGEPFQMLGNDGETVQWIAASMSSGSVAAVTGSGMLALFDDSLRPGRSIKLPETASRIWFDDRADIALIKFSDRLETWSLSRAVRIDFVSIPPDAEVQTVWRDRAIRVTRLDGSSYEDDLLRRAYAYIDLAVMQGASPQTFVDYARAIVLDDYAKPDVVPSAPPSFLEKVGLRNFAVAECDRLAANPFDPQRTRRGVEFERIDAVAAADRCQEARQAEPRNARITYQLGRALRKAQKSREADAVNAEATAEGYLMARYATAVENLRRPAEASQAARTLEDLALKGVLAAKVDLGIAFFDGLGVDKDRAKAFRLWDEAAKENDPRAGEQLGQALLREAKQDTDKTVALKYLIAASAQFKKMGIGGSGIAATRGSLARSLPISSVIAAVDAAKKQLERRH